MLVSLSVLCGPGCSEPVRPELSAADVQVADPVEQLLAAAFQERCRLTPYETNRTLAGQVVAVEGVVSMVGAVPERGPFVMLVGGRKGRNPVLCWLQDPQPWATVAPGMQLTIKGQFERLPPRASYEDAPPVPTLRQSVIVAVQTSTEQLVDLSARELCEAVADRERGSTYFQDKWLWVEGQVLSVDPIQSQFYLEGGDSWVIVCERPEQQPAAEFLSFETGARIRVMGHFEQAGAKRVVLSGCLVSPARSPEDSGGDE